MTRVHDSAYREPEDRYARHRCVNCPHLIYGDHRPGDPCLYGEGCGCTDHRRSEEKAVMTPEQRIDALAFNAASRALGDADEWLRLTARQKVARAVVAAVLPEYEKQLREQIAAEILADVEPFFAARIGPEMWEAAYRAARVARGVS